MALRIVVLLLLSVMLEYLGLCKAQGSEFTCQYSAPGKREMAYCSLKEDLNGTKAFKANG